MINSNSCIVSRAPQCQCDAKSNVHEPVKKPVLRVAFCIKCFTCSRQGDTQEFNSIKHGARPACLLWFKPKQQPLSQPQNVQGDDAKAQMDLKRSDAGEHEASSLQTGKDFVS